MYKDKREGRKEEMEPNKQSETNSSSCWVWQNLTVISVLRRLRYESHSESKVDVGESLSENSNAGQDEKEAGDKE